MATRDKLKISQPGLITPELWNALVDVAFGGLITAFNGGSYARVDGVGTILAVKQGGAAGTAGFPFQVIPSGSGEVRVRFGTIDGIVPTGMTFGDVPPFTLSVSGSGAVVAQITVVAGAITEVQIVSQESVSADSLDYDEDGLAVGTAYLVLAFFSTDSGVISVSQSVSGSQDVMLCGASIYYQLI